MQRRPLQKGKTGKKMRLRAQKRVVKRLPRHRAAEREIKPPVRVCRRHKNNKESYIMQSKECKPRFVISVSDNQTVNSHAFTQQIAKEINEGRITKLSQAQKFLKNLLGGEDVD